jgi:hypothetical protein
MTTDGVALPAAGAGRLSRGPIVVALVLAVAAALLGGLHWATSTTPLVAGSITTSPLGFSHARPGSVTWERGGQYVVSLWLENTGRLPITVTGAVSSGPHKAGAIRGPSVGLTVVNEPARYTAFHPVTIDSGDARAISFVYHANPAACGSMGPATGETVEAVGVRFTVAGVFHDTQYIPLGGSSVTVEAPPASACR